MNDGGDGCDSGDNGDGDGGGDGGKRVGVEGGDDPFARGGRGGDVETRV